MKRAARLPGSVVLSIVLLLSPGFAAHAQAAAQPLVRDPSWSNSNLRWVSLDGRDRGRTCGTPEALPQEIARVRSELRAYLENHVSPPGGGVIPVAVHVITSGAEGDVTDGQIDDQIRELNRGYAGTGYRFELASVDRTENKSWFKMIPGTGSEKQAKLALASDPAHRLNLYTANPGKGFLGWAYFPWSVPESDPLHGVVVHYGSLPGGFLARYNLGRTATHEVGHYLGLLHTFQGGCDEPGDLVDDTPFEASPAFGCMEGRNTCPQPGDDPIHNYMDYSDDGCLTEFTPGQDSRMDNLVPLYRPSLLRSALVATAGGGRTAESALGPIALEFHGAFPNPVRNATQLHFTLNRAAAVSIRLYDVSGRLVRRVVEDRFAAGEHSVRASVTGLGAGVYFAALSSDGVEARGSVLVMP